MLRFLLCYAFLLSLSAAVPPSVKGAAQPLSTTTSAPQAQARAAAVRASQRRIDSLQALIAARPQLDTLKVILVTRLASEIQLRNVRAAQPVLQQAVQLARQLNYRDYEAETRLDLADHYILLTEYAAANQELREARRQFTRLHNVGGQVRCVGRLAKIAAQQGRYAQALAYCFQVPPSANTGDTRRFYTNLLIQTGSIYRQLGEDAKAEEYFGQALRTCRRYDYPDRLNLALGELGELRRQQRRWVEARQYYAQSLAVSERLHLAPEILHMQINLAEMDEQLGHFAAALLRGHHTLRQAQAAALPLAVLRGEALLARASLRAGRLDSAVYYAQQSLSASTRHRSQEGIRAAAEVLTYAYAQQGRFDRAYQAQQQFVAARDSLTGAEVSRRTVALELNHQLRQQQAQIQLLTQQTRLQQQQQELNRLHQRWQALLLLGVVGLVVGLSALAFWQYRRRQAAREAALRTSLAADLHDDVGSLLTQISMQSTMLREGLYPPEQQRQHLDHMAETSRQAARQMSDVVWGIDARNDSLTSVLDRMRDHAYLVLPPAGVELDFVADPDLTTASVPLAARQALYLIYKEALHNAVKHADARQVTVRLRLRGRQLELDVHDDGRGAKVPSRPMGQGLRNMQARATAAAGSVSYDASGPGFRVVARLPLS